MDDPKQLINRFVEELWNERRLDVADRDLRQGLCNTSAAVGRAS
jgi:hypothetical protein